MPRLRQLLPILLIAVAISAPAAAAAPSDAEALLSQALEFCRRVGEGETRAAMVKKAQRAGWQRITRDTTGLHTYELLENEVVWELPKPRDSDRFHEVHLIFYDLPAENGWRAVCGIEVHGEMRRFNSLFQRTRRFASRLKPAAPDQDLDRAQVEKLDLGERVEWFGDKRWRLEFGRYGDDDNFWTGLTYSVAADTEPPPE